MDCKYSGSSKQRRDLLKAETELLGDELPFEFGKLSQLRILKAACTYLKKEKHFAFFKNQTLSARPTPFMDRFFDLHGTIRNDGLLGFVVCFTRTGELIYLSESITDYLGFNSLDILLNYDYIYELAHNCDRQFYDDLKESFGSYVDGNKFSFFSLLFASKVKRKQTSLSEYKLFKITGSYDILTQTYIATCVPVLSVSNRDLLSSYNADCFTSVHKLDLRICQLDDVAESLLGYQTDNITDMSLYDLLSDNCLKIVSDRHRQILNSKNTKGFLDPIQLLHKDGYYISCLLNMFYDQTGLLICKYQIMKPSDVAKYSEYVLKFKRDWFSAHSASREPDADEPEESSDDILDNSSVSAAKRHIDDDLIVFDEDYLTNKRVKSEPEEIAATTAEATFSFYEPQPIQEEQIVILPALEQTRQTLCRTASADVKISIIKEEITNELAWLRISSNQQQPLNSSFDSTSEIEDLAEEDYLEVPCLSEPYSSDTITTAPAATESYVFYDQPHTMYGYETNEFLYEHPGCYYDIYASTEAKLMPAKQQQYEETDEFATHFDFNESHWPEAFEELF